jgi:hypothetical protein
MDLDYNFKKRMNIAKLLAADNPESSLSRLSSRYHVFLLKPWYEFHYPSDCREWVFEEIGLVELTKRVNCITYARFGEKLESEEIKQLRKVEKPFPGALVAYIDEKMEKGPYNHYGLCRGFVNGAIMVDSKWGELDLFRHDINSVLPWVGYKVDFFQKV